MDKFKMNEWVEGLRERARSAVRGGRAPIRTDEAWRFAPVSEFGDREYGAEDGVVAVSGDVPRMFGPERLAARVVMGNGRLMVLEGSAGGWGSVKALGEATSVDWVRGVLGTMESPLGSDRFAAIHRSEVLEGAVIEIDGALDEGKVIEVVHLVKGSGVRVAPFCAVLVRGGGSATVVERFLGIGDADVSVVGATHLRVETGGVLRYAAAQELGPRTVSLQMNHVEVGAGGSAHLLGLQLGGRVSRVETSSVLRGAGARCEMLSVCHATGSRWFDQRTLQDHVSADASSDLLFKNALDDGARSIFSGLIRVGREAHRTDAYQKVRNLVLSDEAEANSMPGLEILADEVRCTHGATTGQLDADELFYLKARGIPDRAARRLITGGFLDEAISRFPDGSVREAFSQRVAVSLRGSSST
jgi:Fe-S cluster assembly protein SufD